MTKRSRCLRFGLQRAAGGAIAVDERTLNGLGKVGVKRLFKDSSNAQRDFRPLSREDV